MLNNKIVLPSAPIIVPEIVALFLTNSSSTSEHEEKVRILKI